MKRFLTACALLILLVAAARAANSPVSLSHSLTKHTKGSDSISVDFILHVKNMTGSTLSEVSLTYVPLMLLSAGEVILDIGDIAAGTAKDIPFTIILPKHLSEDELFKHPLFWAGEYLVDGENKIEFPAESQAIK